MSALSRRDVAVDLGTANTVVYVRGEGIVLFEPSVVAIDERTSAVHAVGTEAKRMIGRTPATIRAIRPLRHGVIADFEVTEQMLRYFLRRVEHGRLARPRVVMCAPSGVTDVEKRSAEQLKCDLGSAHALRPELQEDIRGRDLAAGLPKTVLLGSEELREALSEPVRAIVEAVKETLEETPPELASDIADRGIMLAGGGSLLRGFDDRLQAETGMPTHLAESPLTCVAVGAGRSLDEFEAMAHSGDRRRRRS